MGFENGKVTKLKSIVVNEAERPAGLFLLFSLKIFQLKQVVEVPVQIIGGLNENCA